MRSVCIIAVSVALGIGCRGSEVMRSDAPAIWRLEADATVGGADDGPSSFSDIRDIAVDSRNRLYVLEAEAQQVRIFDTAGTFVRSIGRPGDGPGEFRGANGIALDQADVLWVYDARARRISAFDSSGVLVNTYAAASTTRGFAWTGGVDSTGGVYAEQLVREDTTGRKIILRLDTPSQSVDTIPWPECGVALAPMYRFRSERSSGVMRVPFASGLYQKVDPRGFTWCADSRTLRAEQYRFGDSVPIRTISATVTAAEVTPMERESALTEVRQFGGRIGRGDIDVQLIPQTKPVLQGIEVDDRGAIWVRAVTPNGIQLFIFDSTGTQTAHAQFPGPLLEWHPMVVRDDRLYAVVTDSLDVPVVARFRVVKE